MKLPAISNTNIMVIAKTTVYETLRQGDLIKNERAFK